MLSIKKSKIAAHFDNFIGRTLRPAFEKYEKINPTMM
jgi:hypothetical protein